jgi:phosphatidylserine decarboxylase
MNHYSGWPFATGSGGNLLVATGLWVITAVFYFLTRHKALRPLLLLLTPLWLIILYFFRDPERHTLQDGRVVVSPGDGEVVEITPLYEDKYLQADTVRISIFLSLFDVHVQRFPVSGIIDTIEHVPGKYLQAFRPEASDVNEYMATVIETTHGRVLLKQIAGILARRCVHYHTPGTVVNAGERLGLIRFGSRLDLFLPADTAVTVQVGDKVYGGLTPLARWTTNA